LADEGQRVELQSEENQVCAFGGEFTPLIKDLNYWATKDDQGDSCRNGERENGA
jgi:hypothetical protein